MRLCMWQQQWMSWEKWPVVGWKEDIHLEMARWIGQVRSMDTKYKFMNVIFSFSSHEQWSCLKLTIFFFSSFTTFLFRWYTLTELSVKEKWNFIDIERILAHTHTHIFTKKRWRRWKGRGKIGKNTRGREIFIHYCKKYCKNYSQKLW